MKTLICSALLIAATFAHADQNSDKVTITVSPSSPMVISTDYAMTQTKIVRAPWFAHNVKIKNDSNETLTIIAIQYSIWNMASSPATEADVSVSPGFNNFTVSCGGGATQNIQYTDFGMYLPGTEMPLTLTYRGVLGTGCPTINPITPVIYVGDVGTKIRDPFDYHVEMRLIGWFGTVNEPSSRYDQTVNFTAY